MLASFAAKDRADMVKDGKVVVTCEFCSSLYEFTPQEAGVEQAVLVGTRLVCRRHRMMLVRDEPVAIDLAQPDGQPERESALFCRTA
jgi:Hsp33 protein